MKNRIVIALLLAGILILPAFAQQSSKLPDSARNPERSDRPGRCSPVDNATGKTPLQPDTHEGFLGKLNPLPAKSMSSADCSHPRPHQRLDELTASNSKAIKDTDARAQQGIQLASAKANEADQHAIDAGNRATAAQQTAQQAHTRLNTVEQVVTNIDQYQASTQTEIRFKPGQTLLSKNAKEALDQMATPLKSQRGYIIEVQASRPVTDRPPSATRRRWLSRCPLPRSQPRDSCLPNLSRRHGQRAGAGDRGRYDYQAQADLRRPRRNQPPEEQSGATGFVVNCPRCLPPPTNSNHRNKNVLPLSERASRGKREAFLFPRRWA